MKNKKIKIAPSILACDLTKLASQIKEAEEGSADLFHIDIMDGQFVPNITFGPHLTADINKITDLPLDVHLMIINPGNFIENFIDSGADNLTLHIESTVHVHRHLEKIKTMGATAGISLNPGTPISSIIEILDIVDLVLVMSVNPGFGGQKFIKSSLEKIKKLNEIRIENNYSFQIEVDGGVSENNAESLVSSGVDILVAGNSIFKSPDIKSAIRDIRSQAEKAC
ncbi:ribulose-phosphate 3-epimerase [candidate division KSB1 bacterium]